MIHFPNLSDEMIESRIIRLADNQQERFEEEIKDGKDRRQALFIALSIPIEIE